MSVSVKGKRLTGFSDLPPEIVQNIVHYFANADRDTAATAVGGRSELYESSEMQRSARLQKRRHALGQLRLVCRLLNSWAASAFWERISSTGTRNIRSTLLKDPKSRRYIWPNVRELEVVVANFKDGFSCEDKPKRLRGVWHCCNLRTLHIHDIWQAHRWEALPDNWDKFCPHLEEGE